MKLKLTTYKPILLQLVLIVLVCFVILKPTVLLISSLSVNSDNLELTETIDLEDELEDRIDKTLFQFKSFNFKTQIITQKKLNFDNYSCQIFEIYSDIYLLPPKRRV